MSGLNVSRETLSLLEKYADLLKKWNPRINLVSKSTIDNLWERHIVDSVQVFDLAPPEFRTWVDLGSGGGFPGLVCAIMAAEKAPDSQFTLVESDTRKCVFLRTVIRETGLNAKVISKRIESIDPLNADVLTARALADLDQLMSFAKQHMRESGTAIFPKGANWEKELHTAQNSWLFDWEATKSKTESNAVILKIGGIRRV